MKKLIYIYIVSLSLSSYSQEKRIDSYPNNSEEYIFINPKDTLNIVFDEFTLFPKYKFKSKEDVRYYLWFRKKVFKAYPYALLASKRLDSLNLRLKKIKKRRKRKKYTKLVQKYIEDKFSEQVKKLTTTEGRILIKLIHRQTGKTVFENIKTLRSGWRAFWYNITSNFFKLSLKTEYSPAKINEDYLIEDILQRAFQDGKLEFQATKLNFDFNKIIAEKKGEVNVEKYKLMFYKQRKK